MHLTSAKLKPSIAALLIALFWAQLGVAQLTPRANSSFSNPSQSRPVPLSQEEAFPFYVSEVGPGKLRVNWTAAQGHYLYRHAFRFSISTGTDSKQALRQVDFELPPGLKKTDEFFGDIEAYYGRVAADLSLPNELSSDGILIIEYQGCADWGFCYPPQKVEHRLLP